MKKYEDLINAIYTMYAEAFRSSFPPDKKERLLWSNPERLDWIAIGKEQERFYLNYACGEATRNDCSVRGYLRPLGVMEAGSAERKILDMADYELVDWNELEKSLDIDEEMEFEFMDDRRSFSEFLIQCAMGPVMLRIKQDVLPELDIPKGQDFEATIFNDIEASSLNDRAPRFSAYCLD
ncbi:MAG: hypothetical protein GY754_44430, partial [bacterium]|nr:hypothetical protein [bacterium]